MEFACLRCREHVRVALGANGRELAEISATATAASSSARANDGRDEPPTAPAVSGSSSAQDKELVKGSEHAARRVAVRCRRCDGLYHAPCVAAAGRSLSEFECARCCRGAETEEDSGDEDDSEPLLLPPAALALMAENGREAPPEEDEEWAVVTKEVDVCTACRQVNIAPSSLASCAQCHAAARRHRECAMEVALPSPGRKRKRSQAMSPAGGLDSPTACPSCDVAGNLVRRRRVGVLVPKGDVVWWETCLSCQGDFCLHPLVGDEEEEDDALRNRIGRETELGFFCRACIDRSASRETAPPSVSVDAALDGMLPVEDEGTILLCDGCEGEFDMAKLDPPLHEVPEGDWFCPTCRSQHFGVLDGDATMVTLLICDGCENEFDMAAVLPPLESIPEGDWFCSDCLKENQEISGATQDHLYVSANGKQAEETTFGPSTNKVSSADALVSNQKDQLSATSDTLQEPAKTDHGIGTENGVEQSKPEDELVPLIECDGCDDKFDIRTIRPAAPEVPKGDWFCDECEATRKRRKKGYAALKQEKARRVKARAEGIIIPINRGLSVARPISPRVKLEPRRSLVPGQPPSSTVTLLICDGCDGEFDMTTLSPPLASVPRGDWYCSACVSRGRNTAAFQRPTPSTTACTVCKGPVRWNRDAQRAARKRGDMTVLCNPCIQARMSSRPPQPPPPPPIVGIPREEKKRKRPVDVIQHDGRLQVDPVERIFAPVPVTVSYSSSSASNGSALSNTSNSATCGHVVCTDDEGDGMSDDDDDLIIIVCEICLSEFNMIDVLGDSQSLTPPPRPWYCLPCLRRLKKNRKKKQRISKQMMLEMQLYGGLLRPTAAKAVDPMVRLLRGKKPTADEEILALGELVGKRVGVLLSWDKHWVMGRVLSFEVASCNHLIRYDDESEQVLPLFAFPFVIGTSRVIEVKVPASQNRWWPAQVLKMNAIAERHLLQTLEDPGVLRSMRLVRLFSSTANATKTESVACWVPRHLCRALSENSKGEATDTDEDYKALVREALNEDQIERSVRMVAFKALLRSAQDGGDDVWSSFAQALVGCELLVNGNRTVTIKDFDPVSGLHRLCSGEDDEVQIKLVQVINDMAIDAHTLAKLELALNKALRGLDIVPSNSSELEPEPSDPELKFVPSRTSSIRPPPTDSDGQCDKCRLPPVLGGDTSDVAVDNALVKCVKCSNTFHSFCCDPPHGAFPLVSSEDGAVLVEDIKSPFICRDCVSCAGCQTTTSTRWYRWRLPLQVVSLCENCVTIYDNKCQCAVCNKCLEDSLVNESTNLLKCTSCDLWVHPHCEPDPHPAFRRRLHHEPQEFELDIDIPLPDLSVKQQDQDDDEEEDAAHQSSKSANGHSTKPARLVDEDCAFSLKFKETYDARVFNNYECLSCRKVRLLRVLQRLRMEDKLDLFKEPVTKLIAPTYFDVIKQPMDLATMQQKVLDDEYTRVNFRDFRDDFELLCLNAVTFNSRDRDFLIWREAWRFYGQGQKILRLVAPKARMKQRGGKHYDALVLAAKRQLPNNSQLGKTKQFAGGSEEDDDDDEDGDDEDDVEVDPLDDEGDNDGLDDSGSGRESTSRVTDVDNGVGLGDDELGRDSLSLKPETSGLSYPDALASAKPAVERRRAMDGIVRLTFVPQSELGSIPKPHSSLSFYLTMHSRSGAHAYCWIDTCCLCGTRGSHNDDMIFCTDCGEGFHTFCCGVDETKFALKDHPIHTYWRCANCEMCEVCGKPHDKESEGEENEWMECSHCDRSFHGKCLLPAIGSKKDLPPTEDDDSDDAPPQPESFYCSSCVVCKICDKVQPRASYSYDRELCLSCCQAQKSEQNIMSAKTKHLIQVWASDARKQRKDAEKCPMCMNKWTAEDADLIQCDACEFWAHPLCDVAFAEDPSKYQELVNDPSAQYVCSVCRSHERTHLRSTPNLAKCQLLLDKIQNARMLCDARWVEARAQMRQTQLWNEWKDNLAIYLYVLRIGEECLKNLAYRSVNFQDDWARYLMKNKAQVVPAWLVQKAARYLRYKRYARGPRAAQRKLARKTENFYSQQGIDRQKEPHAIATVAAQASSCAALIVCVHLLYGWAPLQRVVFHLLEGEGARLSDELVRSLLIDNSDTLDDEIMKIKNQYERRARKKHLLRVQTDGEDVDDVFMEEVSPTGSSVSSLDPVSKATEENDDSKISPESDTQNHEQVVDDTTQVTDSSNGAETKEEATNSESPHKAPAILPHKAAISKEHSTTLVRLTRSSPMSGQPKTSLAPGYSSGEDNRFCGLCFIVGDSSLCGRLIYVELDQWVHINCALWSSEVFEDASGVLQKCQKALSRSKTNRCDGCGVLGATLGCTVSRCPRHYHFPCAIDRGVVFLPNGETCCPLPSHVQQGTKNFQLPDLVRLDSLSAAHSILPHVRPADDVAMHQDSAAIPGDGGTIEESTSVEMVDSSVPPNAETEAIDNSDTSAVASISALPPPLVSPLIKEPRHCVQVDFSTVFSDSKKRMNALHLKRQICFRIGALTVHSLGHIVIGNPSFYTRDAVFPLGYRSTRVYWSSRQLSARCVYECVVSSTDVEARKEAKGKDAEDKPYASPKALFKITASDDVDNPIVASSPLEALLELRSRVVALYEDTRCFASSDDNPFLSRRSWFSYGLLGHHFFGFGIPEIAREIEALPHVATTAIRRSYVVQRHRQQNLRKRRRGQDKLLDDEEAKAGDHVYVFSHRLPPAAEMAIAMREVEQVVEAEEHARLSSGAVRTDGLDRQVDEEEEAARRATRRRLNKDATRESSVQTPLEKTAAGPASNETSASSDTTGAVVKEKQGVPMDLEHLPIAMQYRELRRRPFSERLEVLKSKIHGYGLFTKEKFVEGQMIVEYQGQMISQAVADVREKQYEEMGIGSCYMFRLDEKTIIDATRCGNLARFMNHSCDPKAYARVVVVENNEKKIVIFAKRTIEAFEEVTYDYKFPIEDEAIRCDCGAPNCIGRMN